ncbi:MAG: exo-alpha-sialidase, partial [Limisphaerales bacterium]
MKKLYCAILVSLVGTLFSEAQDLKARLVEHRKIWDQAPHNAFTDLIRFKGKWFCAFREGAGHVSPDGFVRVLTTENGLWWEPAARLKMDGLDLRDPKLSISPDGKNLVVIAAAAAR